MDDVPLEHHVERAKAGDRASLEAVIGGLQDRIYNLALRMLWLPADAEDATQEILIQVITHLSAFRGESRFTTWVYRIAANHLLTTRKRRAEREALTFQLFGAQLEARLRGEPAPMEELVDHQLLVEEVKIRCTHGMLLCLDRPHRLAFILGEIFEVSSEQGAQILEVAPATYRKRLSRARTRVGRFMQQKCGLVNPAAPCRCARHGHTVDQRALLFAGHPTALVPLPAVLAGVQELTDLGSAAAVFRGHPQFAAPGGYVERIRGLLEAGTFAVLGDGQPA
jgi:RNA polymerase sigma factor (sigma-70 family)